MVLGDALTHPTISFAHPDWMPAADHHDALGAAAMRRDLLDKLRNGSPACHRLSSAVPWGRQGRTRWLGLSFRAPMADAQRYEQALALCSALTRVHGTQWRRAGATLSEAQQMLERSRLFRC